MLQVAHISLVSMNVSGIFLPSSEPVGIFFSLTAQLLVGLSGLWQTQHKPQSLALSNARCFAGMRVLALNR